MRAMDNIDPMALIREVEAISEATENASPQVPQKAPSNAKPPPLPDPEPAPTKAPAKEKGRKRGAPAASTSVLVPRAVFPTEVCEENGGTGWSATAVPHKRGTSKVSFTTARGDD